MPRIKTPKHPDHENKPPILLRHWQHLRGARRARLRSQPQRSADGLLPDNARYSIREIVGNAMRHLLNFRKETPLSDEQKGKVRSIVETHRGEIRAQFDKGREARRAMADASKAGDTDSKAVQSAAEKIGEVAAPALLRAADVVGLLRHYLPAEVATLSLTHH